MLGMSFVAHSDLEHAKIVLDVIEPRYQCLWSKSSVTGLSKSSDHLREWQCEMIPICPVSASRRLDHDAQGGGEQ